MSSAYDEAPPGIKFKGASKKKRTFGLVEFRYYDSVEGRFEANAMQMLSGARKQQESSLSECKPPTAAGSPVMPRYDDEDFPF